MVNRQQTIYSLLASLSVTGPSAGRAKDFPERELRVVITGCIPRVRAPGLVDPEGVKKTAHVVSSSPSLRISLVANPAVTVDPIYLTL